MINSIVKPSGKEVLSLKNMCARFIQLNYSLFSSRINNELPSDLIEEMNNFYIFNAKIIVPVINTQLNQNELNKIEEKCLACLNEGIAFTIYLFPFNDEEFNVWQQDLITWKQNHPQSIINDLAESSILNVQEYRKTEEWLEAERRVNKLLTDKNEKHIFSKMSDDTETSLKRLRLFRNVDINTLKNKLFKEAIDTVSWLILKPNEENKLMKFDNVVNVLIYDYALNKVPQYLLGRADKMGYRENSLIFAYNFLERKKIVLKKFFV